MLRFFLIYTLVYSTLERPDTISRVFSVLVFMYFFRVIHLFVCLNPSLCSTSLSILVGSEFSFPFRISKKAVLGEWFVCQTRYAKPEFYSIYFLFYLFMYYYYIFMFDKISFITPLLL